MNIWTVVLISSIIVAATKFVGYVLPASVTGGDKIQRMSDAVTVALLASLVVIQSIGAGVTLALDARIYAVIVAGILFWRKVPFFVVIVVAALVAAALRLLGWAA